MSKDCDKCWRHHGSDGKIYCHSQYGILYEKPSKICNDYQHWLLEAIIYWFVMIGVTVSVIGLGVMTGLVIAYH